MADLNSSATRPSAAPSPASTNERRCPHCSARTLPEHRFFPNWGEVLRPWVAAPSADSRRRLGGTLGAPAQPPADAEPMLTLDIQPDPDYADPNRRRKKRKRKRFY